MHIALSITEGRTVRDLFYNGLLHDLTEAGSTVSVFTEAVHVKPFIHEWSLPGVSFHMLYPCQPTAGRSRALRARRSVAKLNSRTLLNLYRSWEDKRFYAPRPEYLAEFQQRRPDVYFSTHSQLSAEAELLNAARTLGIPTIGMVRSWDNVFKGIRCRPDRMCVWNEVNRKELISQERYPAADTIAVGAPQFDCYFQDDVAWDKDQLYRHFKLDPDRGYILFASNGYYEPGFDETCWLESLLEKIDDGSIPGRPQVICRLHPWSRLEHFQRFADHPDVRMSYVEKYLPVLTWYMDRFDMGVMSNMLRHADVIVTPGSTVVLEAAIFNRPCVVPVFHTYQPDRSREYFRINAFSKHYARIRKLDLIPIANSLDEYVNVINRFREEPDWHAASRHQLVRDYVSFTDGKSTRRIASMLLEAGGAKATIR